MPVPTPRSGEDKTKFLARCHKFLHDENKTRKEKRPDKQISGICYSQWRESKQGTIVRSEAIPILRSFESEGKRYLYGYTALFDSPDCYGTLCTREIVESSWDHLQKFPAVRFMHKMPLGQILFDESVDGMSTFVDDHGFHVLVQVYDERDDEWGMITSGHWGFSYGLLPAPNGIKEKCLSNGKCYKAFVKGIFYEVSVVDAPAHSDAVAYVIQRFINGNVGGDITNGDIEMNEKEIKELLTDMETRIVERLKKKDENEDDEKKAEEKIIARVTAAIQAKKNSAFTTESLKAMEDRIMKAVSTQIEKVFPAKKTTEIQNTFNETEKALKTMQDKIANLKSIENSLKLAGEDSKAVSERITQLEAQYTDFSKNVVSSVETVVTRQLGDISKRVAAIENVPEFRSPVTATQRAGSVIRGFGFGAMLNAAMGVDEQ